MTVAQIHLYPLLVILAAGKSRLFRLDQPLTSLGRAPESTIRLQNPHVSRQQTLLIRQSDGSFLLCDGDGQDQPSTNGTFVNGVAVERRYLQDGDVIVLGHPEIVALFFQPKQDLCAEDDPNL